ncbi:MULTISPECIES: PAS domain S-box protein [unclassified Bradyrhizobium]|uniref:PAS domain-containing sensor histidine kinase n=1 Tax=unclassified Bradyrhizobium TaxID=2631580 RepID=UPI001FF76D4F|nr:MULTISPECIES: PAS domain S-box protein [unclassified Bradyrhizobium]MCK1319631.1 PAS domain S-box protein [Bradyrhizobium sp. 156]
MPLSQSRSAPAGSIEQALEDCRRELASARALNQRFQAERSELAAVLEGSRDAIWRWDPDGTIVRWNKAAEHLFGYSAEEMIGTSLLRLIPSDRHVKAKAVIASVRAGASYAHYETVRIRKDGTAVDLEMTVSPILGEAGDVLGVSTMCREITERKQFEASLAQRLTELTAIHALSERLQAANRLDEIYGAALDAITTALDCDCASILLFDANKVMRFVASRGLSEAYREAVDGHSPWNADAAAPQAIFLADMEASEQSPELKEIVAREGLRGLAFVPLLTDGRLIGKFMAYYRAPHVFPRTEIDLASTIGRQLALSIARRLAEEELRESEMRFRVMAENAPVMIWISDREGRCLHLNERLRAFWGVTEDRVGEFDWATTLHPDDAPAVARSVMEGIKNRSGFSVKARYLDAQGRYRVLETRAHPHLSAGGELMGMIGANVDITEREEAERARELLVAELNHRVKNTLAIVQGIAHQTFGHGGDPTEARKAFEGRLVALAGAHNLLTEANWENASLQELAAITLDTAGANANRISLAGPSVLLSPKQAVSIGMALHELCTNARKYGALSTEEGRITLEWFQKNGGARPELCMRWQESGGPPVSKPLRRGFGTVLLERALAHDLDGDVTIGFEPEGLQCFVTAPIQRPTGVPLSVQIQS